VRFPLFPNLSLPFLPNLDQATLRRYLITGAVVLLALVLVWELWWHYLRSPWTRDGRINVEVVNIASEVAGKVVTLNVIDNQPIKKGDVLFEIEPVDYRIALVQAEAAVASRKFDRDNALQESQRRQKLGAQAVSSEEMNTALSTAHVTEVTYQAAVAARDQAQVNLDRTTIRSPVNGYVTNLVLRIGDYATPGQTKMSLVDSDSFWVVGYFEETKLPGIHEGDYAHVRLMGWHPEIAGHVLSFSRAIANTNSNPNFEGLADVNPIFTWVRLAQRIPVRIQIDHVPDEVKIVAGQTCTIVLDRAKKKSPEASAASSPSTVTP
jgi:RND family efflux transporter MFP subunit